MNGFDQFRFGLPRVLTSTGVGLTILLGLRTMESESADILFLLNGTFTDAFGSIPSGYANVFLLFLAFIIGEIATPMGRIARRFILRNPPNEALRFLVLASYQNHYIFNRYQRAEKAIDLFDGITTVGMVLAIQAAVLSINSSEWMLTSFAFFMLGFLGMFGSNFTVSELDSDLSKFVESLPDDTPVVPPKDD